MKEKHLLACALAFAWAQAGFAQTWIAVNLPSRDWTRPAYSTNGDKIVVAARGEGIYFSTNSGLDWTLTSAPKTNWTSVACSADASEIVATVSRNEEVFPYNNVPGQIYISTNSGLTWDVSSAPFENWSSVACSADGRTLLAAGGDDFVPGFLYTSTNSGATWTTSANLEDTWTYVTMSPDGGRMFAENDHSSGTFLSTNLWVNWDRTGTPNNFAIAKDGQRLLSFGTQGLYVSDDSGMTGTFLNESVGMTFLAASEDGLGVVGSQVSGALFTSSDGGTNFSRVPNSGGNWQSLGASPNGAWRIAMEGFGRTWISYAPDSPPFFVVQPIASTNVYEATAVTLKAAALGSAPMAFQWQLNGTNLSDDARITGSATAELTITNLQVSDSGVYTLVATNGLGATNSEPTALTVNADVVPPSVQIVTPAPGDKWAAVTFQANGTASDNSRVTSVWYQLNSGFWSAALTTDDWHSWYLNFSPTDGTNTLSVYAVDQMGNVSPTNTVSFTVIRQSPMFVQISGQGRVNPNYDGQILTVGSVYKMKANPAHGYIFAGWSGHLEASTRVLSFTMADDISVEADFIPNPFPAVRGRYLGSALRTNSFSVPIIQPESFHARVFPNGLYVGKMQDRLNTYHFSGKFSASGAASFSIPRKGSTPIDAQLQLDLSGGNTLTAIFTEDGVVTGITADKVSP
jgi:hypothetical protein